LLVNDDDVKDDDYIPDNDESEDDEYYDDDDFQNERNIRFREENEFINEQEEEDNQEENLVQEDEKDNQENFVQEEKDLNNAYDDVYSDPDCQEDNQIVENVDERNLRRSDRIRNQSNGSILPGFLGRFMKMNGKENSLNYIQAKSSPRWKDYRVAMFDFIKKLEENNGFSIIPKPTNVNIIGSRWVFSDKYDASGNYVKAKARLTPLGYQQTFAPEVYAANEAAKSVNWLINFLNELNFEYDVPLMYEDCNNAISWIVEKKSTMRTRHFELRLQFVREMVEDNLLKVQYINTNENIADMMTKIVGKNKYKMFIKKIGLFNSEEVLMN